jgi:hypothetical protein
MERSAFLLGGSDGKPFRPVTGYLAAAEAGE